MAALEAAGIDRDQLDGVSTTGRANEFVFGVPGGAPLISMRSGAASSGAAHGSSTVDRHRLRDLLLSSLPADAVRWGAAVRGYTPLSDGSGVRVRCSDGTEHEGCLLVGADGVRSPVRAQLVGDLLRSTGVLTLGGRVPSTLVPMFSSMMAATGAACGMRLADPRAPGSSALYTGDGSSLFCTHGDLPCGPSGRVQHAFAFSFGMLLVEMITGRRPGKHGWLERTPRNKFNFEMADLEAAIPPECPDSLTECVKQCLAYEPDDRLDSDSMLEWLQELYAEMEGDEAAPKPTDILGGAAIGSASHADAQAKAAQDAVAAAVAGQGTAGGSSAFASKLAPRRPAFKPSLGGVGEASVIEE